MFEKYGVTEENPDTVYYVWEWSGWGVGIKGRVLIV
jgi:hypothetical protein